MDALKLQCKKQKHRGEGEEKEDSISMRITVADRQHLQPN